jgi:hypothetical protein
MDESNGAVGVSARQQPFCKVQILGAGKSLARVGKKTDLMANDTSASQCERQCNTAVAWIKRIQRRLFHLLRRVSQVFVQSAHK